jgi:hypothetical protein
MTARPTQTAFLERLGTWLGLMPAQQSLAAARAVGILPPGRMGKPAPLSAQDAAAVIAVWALPKIGAVSSRTEAARRLGEHGPLLEKIRAAMRTGDDVEFSWLNGKRPAAVHTMRISGVMLREIGAAVESAMAWPPKRPRRKARQEPVEANEISGGRIVV